MKIGLACLTLTWARACRFWIALTYFPTCRLPTGLPEPDFGSYCLPLPYASNNFDNLPKIDWTLPADNLQGHQHSPNLSPINLKSISCTFVFPPLSLFIRNLQMSSGDESNILTFENSLKNFSNSFSYKFLFPVLNVIH